MERSFPIATPTTTRRNLPSFKPFRFFSRFTHYQFHSTLKINSNAVRSSVRSSLNNDHNSNTSGNGGGDSNIWWETEFVEVFGVGSRKDAVLDYCFASPSLSPALRFWNINMKDSSGFQLQQRYPVEAIGKRNAEAPLSSWLGSKAVILVASTGYSYDQITVFDILRAVKAGSGVVVSIVLKPFSFEGQKRQDEVKGLISELQKLSTFCIAVDTDALLEKDLVTLDEAINTSNNAVLVAINAISAFISEKHMKLLYLRGSETKDLKVLEHTKILENYKEGRIGFGSSYNIETSILQATCGCPFLGASVQASEVVIACIHANPDIIGCIDTGEVAHTFRLTAEFEGTLILSLMPDPAVEPKLIATTVIAFGFDEESSSPKPSLLSRLAQHFPFVFDIMSKKKEQVPNMRESMCSEIHALNSGQTADGSLLNSTPESIEPDSSVPQASVSGDDNLPALRGDGSGSDHSDFEFVEASSQALTCILNTEGISSFKRKLQTTQNFGLGYKTTKHVKNGSDHAGDRAVGTSVSIFRLPVGVKHSRQLKNYPIPPNVKHHFEQITEYNRNVQTRATMNLPRDIVVNAASDTGVDLRKNVVAFGKRISDSTYKRQGGLASRAASMLEAERHSKKMLNPIVEMKYRGGTYRGHVQGGLPEGKGCLSLPDGSIYDGMWRYGKRSGLGLFYYNNGDLYQGSWRDDLMHGKGWLYFHSGDRWFVNFWKGKANGEGRFYSKHGDVFFGHFKDGWRNGEFLHVSVDGTRFQEVWGEGILVGHVELDPDDASGAGS